MRVRDMFSKNEKYLSYFYIIVFLILSCKVESNTNIKNKILDEESMIESVMAFKRAGACAIVTYFAMEIAKNIQTYN